MERGKGRGREDSEEEEEYKVEDLNEESSNLNTNRLGSNWKNRLKLLRNYSSLDTSVSVRNGQGRESSADGTARGLLIHPDNWLVIFTLLIRQFI